MSGKDRLKTLEQFRNDEEESKNSFVYDILSEGHLQATAHRHRSYSMHSSKYLIQDNSTKKRQNQQRRMSLPQNGSVFQKDRLNVTLFTDYTLAKEDQEQGDSKNILRNRRARSFKERSSEAGQTNHRRVRSFKTTSKGLVNRGDSFKVKKEAHNDQLNNKNVKDDSTIQTFNNCVIPQLITTECSVDQSNIRVLLTGARGVGKSSIIDQFMTSEFLGNGSFNVCK
jgi:hypothetical protein